MIYQSDIKTMAKSSLFWLCPLSLGVSLHLHLYVQKHWQQEIKRLFAEKIKPSTSLSVFLFLSLSLKCQSVSLCHCLPFSVCVSVGPLSTHLQLSKVFFVMRHDWSMLTQQSLGTVYHDVSKTRKKLKNVQVVCSSASECLSVEWMTAETNYSLMPSTPSPFRLRHQAAVHLLTAPVCLFAKCCRPPQGPQSRSTAGTALGWRC